MALAKQETQRLRFLETHQDEIRAELYQNLADAVAAQDHDGAIAAGKREVPPPHDYDEERLNRPESPGASGARRAPSPTPGADAESCACSAGFDGASASGLRVDVCPCCDEYAPLDPFSNLCVPCEADACD